MDDANSKENVDYQTTAAKPVQTPEPKDNYRIVQITMYFFGITSLLPWNFFIQANDYWMYKLRNTSVAFNPTSEDKTDLQAMFSSYLSIASKVPYVLFLLVNAVLSNRFLPSKRIQYPLMVMILLFVFTTVIVLINTDGNQDGFFGVTIATVIAINAMCGFFQGGGTGIAGSLPKQYMGYNVNGMALGGILASVAQILSLIGVTKPTTSAFFYFVTATIFLCVTFLFFRLTIKSEIYTYYMSKQTSMVKNNSIPEKGKLQQNERHFSNWEVFKQIWVYALSLVLIFWVTIAILPAVLVLVLSTSTTHSIWTGRLYLPVACFLLFNVSDFVSRIVALQLSIPVKLKFVTLALSVMRIVFIPLLMLCNAHPRHHMPVVFNSDIDFIVIIVFFAFTGGYLCTVILTQGPKQVRDEHQEAAGSQMAFFLGLGLMLGSVTSYGLVKLL